MARIGVLALQGAFREHVDIVRGLGYECSEIRKAEELDEIHGLILPGGESTAMGKLLVDFGIRDILAQKIKDGLPVWGTCAGMILLAKVIADQENTHLSLMDIRVRRNAYGRQLGSFFCEAPVAGVADDIKMPFIRAPYIEKAGEGVEVLSVVDNNIVAARKDNLLVTSFHPELTDDTRLHSYFIEKMVG